MRINIDSDGVIYDMQSEIIDLAEARTGREFSMPTSWHIESAWGVTPEFVSGLFNTPGVFSDGPPYTYAVEAVEALVNRGHEVRIVTHKHGLPDERRAMAETILFYERAGLLDKVDLVFPRGDKTAYPADVVIDDKPTLAWAQDDAYNLLFSQPWNEHVQVVRAMPGDGIPRPRRWVQRVDGWRDLAGLLLPKRYVA